MAQTLETLSRQVANMRSIRSIVHTMKTLSFINSVPYEHAARAVEAFHDNVLRGFSAFLAHSGPLSLLSGDVSSRTIVVFGSDHGLCGNYNEALAAFVCDNLTADPAQRATVLCVGARMAAAFADKYIVVEETILPPASVDGIGRLAHLLTKRLDDIMLAPHANDMAVALAHVGRGEDAVAAPKITTLLPLGPAFVQALSAEPWASRTLPSYSMPRGDLLKALIRNHIFASLFRAAAEALVTENAARLTLMQKAEQSIDERLQDLMAAARTMRQNEITNELIDVMSGFEALKKRKRHTQATSS